MEKGTNSSPRRMNCIPRLRVNTCTIKNSHRLSPTTLLERFREAVFRLMMLSALSKATHNASSRSSSSTSSSSPNHHHVMKKRSSYYPADPYHSEAVADCIEFIKKSALNDQEEDINCESAAATFDGATEIVLPVPVM